MIDISSYKNNFKSPLGAYAYLFLSQDMPSIMSISNNEELNSNLLEPIENILKNVVSHETMQEQIAKLNCPKDVRQVILDKIELIQHLDIEQNNWSSVEAIIEFNNFGPFIENKEELKKSMDEFVKKYSLNSININISSNPFEFISTMDKELIVFCDTLQLKNEHIGLNFLNLYYQTETGGFTGYVGWANEDDNTPTNLVLKKPQVFAHEWMHYIDCSLGIRSNSLTDIMDLEDPNREKLLSDAFTLPTVLNFKRELHKKIPNYSNKSINEAISGLGHFFEQYAINKQTFKSDLEQLTNEYKNKVHKSNFEQETELFINKIEKLLQGSYPTRYFSFIKAQCEIYNDNKNNTLLETNQMVDFSKKADLDLKEENYTVSTIECLARSFETYVLTKMLENKKTNNLIAEKYDSDFYPQGQLREELNSFWDVSFNELKNSLSEILKKEEERTNKYSLIHCMSNIAVFREKQQQDKLKKQTPIKP